VELDFFSLQAQMVRVRRMVMRNFMGK